MKEHVLINGETLRPHVYINIAVSTMVSSLIRREYQVGDQAQVSEQLIGRVASEIVHEVRPTISEAMVRVSV